MHKNNAQPIFLNLKNTGTQIKFNNNWKKKTGIARTFEILIGERINITKEIPIIKYKILQTIENTYCLGA